MKIELGISEGVSLDNLDHFKLELKEIAKLKYSSIIVSKENPSPKLAPSQQEMGEIAGVYFGIKKEFKETYEKWLNTMKDFDFEMEDIVTILTSVSKLVEEDGELKEDDIKRDKLTQFCGRLKDVLTKEAAYSKRIGGNLEVLKIKVADMEYIQKKMKDYNRV